MRNELISEKQITIIGIGKKWKEKKNYKMTDRKNNGRISRLSKGRILFEEEL